MSTFQALTRLQQVVVSINGREDAIARRGLEKLTNYHDIEVESFSHTLSVPLIRQIGETNVAS